ASNPTGKNLGQTFGIAGVPDTLLPLLNFGGSISPIGNNDLVQSFHDTVIQFDDTVTFIRGHHVVHTGFQAYRYRTNIFYPGNEVNNQINNYDVKTGQVFLGNSAANYKQYNGVTNFQPRLGVAWQPAFVKNTVVRAAYGISNFAESTGTGNLLFQNPPFTIPHN